ncbi:hypothetical protein N0V93_009810 [Gnomoniopsis smithogilvyi]|uniref:Uncharacterized protein n=1 Tax=Gnomoniopsis smithogilvyi TaxID=1191159 RepID=A0A9W8YKS8_9PEZI|nr:hypothetical protein N0V93_009810 [Gnomoniopsis smithogilvyi]
MVVKHRKKTKPPRLLRRSLSRLEDSVKNEPLDAHHLENRDRRRARDVTVKYAGTFYVIVVLARGYPGSSKLHGDQSSSLATDPSDTVFRPVQGSCSGGAIATSSRDTWSTADVRSTLDTEHNPDTASIPATRVNSVWRASVLPNTLPRDSASRWLRTPNDYFMDWFGSNTNRGNLVSADRDMNQMKGRIFADWSVWPQAIDTFNANLDSAVETGEDDDISALFKPFEEIYAVFNYIHHPEMLPLIQEQRRTFWQHRQSSPQDWVADRIIDIVARYTLYESVNGEVAPQAARVLNTLSEYYNRLSEIKPPPEDMNSTGSSDSSSD